MNRSRQNFYHPFQYSFFGFDLGKIDFQNHSTFNIIDNIDLYQQPVEEPSIAMIFFAVRCVIVIMAELCNYRVLVMMKKDRSILNTITKLQAYTIMVSMPIKLIFVTLTDFIHPLNEILGKWICISFWFEENISTQIIASHSLMVVLLRYTFIVHNTKVIEFGKAKLEKLFWNVSIIVPVLTVLWVASDLQDAIPSNHINRCNGMDHKMFLIRSWSSLGLIGTNFHLPNDQINDKLDILFAIMRKLSRIGHRIWRVFLGSNIAEGVIYFKLFRHMTR